MTPPHTEFSIVTQRVWAVSNNQMKFNFLTFPPIYMLFLYESFTVQLTATNKV